MCYWVGLRERLVCGEGWLGVGEGGGWGGCRAKGEPKVG